MRNAYQTWGRPRGRNDPHHSLFNVSSLSRDDWAFSEKRHSACLDDALRGVCLVPYAVRLMPICHAVLCPRSHCAHKVACSPPSTMSAAHAVG